MPRLNRRLLLETPIRQGDNAGGFTTIWQPLGSLWAQVIARSGREATQLGAPVSAVSYRIIVRGAPHNTLQRPKPEQRFRDGDRVFLIQAVAEADDDGRHLTCFATEETAI
ncbi:phage head-tail adaptor, putative, SPP1 family [Roseobacter denitrificans OCh 114]|nr:phage head-tail adaptor, putative, SPP1 family [Roseobacter denitrificans OCh 114]